MAYGKGMRKLSPCSDDTILAAITAVCPAPAALLDLGCGRGGRLAALSRRFPAALCVGADRDEENLAEAKRLFPEGNFVCADAAALPFPDSSFELILCECSLSLFASPERCLDEMRRLLLPGGTLLVAEVCTGESEPISRAAPDGEALGSIFSRGRIERLLTEAGFELLSFQDRSGDLAAMAAQMIFDGSFCSCIGPGTAAILKKLRAGYGLWSCRKKEEARGWPKQETNA